MKEDLDIYYSSMTGFHFISCGCSRWDVQNYSIVIETWLKKSDLQTLRNNITPGAVGELYKILGRPTMYDQTWQGENTLMLSPNTGDNSNLKSMRENTLIYVKNITDNPVEGQSGYLNVKIEGYISGNSSL